MAETVFIPALEAMPHVKSPNGETFTKPFLDVCRLVLPVIEEPSVFGPTLGILAHVRSENNNLLTEPFLDVCRSILPVVDKFGSSMALVKSDVGGNIGRLDAKYATDTTSYYLLYDIVRKEVADKTARNSSSCTNGLLWLTRAMDFLVELFRLLLVHPDWTMSQASNEAYSATLKKWHGWMASAAFTVAMKLVPDRKKFYELLGGGNLNTDIEKFVSTFAPILLENHNFLRSVGMDEMKAS